MLRYSNKEIVLDFELGEGKKYIGSHCVFCSRPEDVRNFFPNLEIRTGRIKESELPNGKVIALSVPELLSLITQWLGRSKIKKLYEWDANDWVNEFLLGVEKAEKALDWEANNDLSACHGLKKWYLEGKRYYSHPGQLFVEDEGIGLPEYSWMLEDCLWHRMNGTISEYRDAVNAIIKSNILQKQEFYIRHNLFRGDGVVKEIPHIRFDIQTCDIKEEDIDMFYSPYQYTMIHSNIMHIKKVIQAWKDLTTQKENLL